MPGLARAVDEAETPRHSSHQRGEEKSEKQGYGKDSQIEHYLPFYLCKRATPRVALILGCSLSSVKGLGSESVPPLPQPRSSGLVHRDTLRRR